MSISYTGSQHVKDNLLSHPFINFLQLTIYSNCVFAELAQNMVNNITMYKSDGLEDHSCTKQRVGSLAMSPEKPPELPPR